jgi:hypothetical protein
MPEHPLTGERIDLGDGAVAWWPCHIGKEQRLVQTPLLGH